MSATEAFAARLEENQKRFLIVGGASLALSVLGASLGAEQFFHSYLVAFLYWVGAGLGCLGVMMLHYLVGGGWGFVIRRFLEAGAKTIPLMAVLFIPLIFGLGSIYSWADPAKVSQDAVLQHKSLYLSTGGFILRAFIYFSLWSGVVYLYGRWGEAQDQTGDPAVTRRLRAISGPGLGIFVLTVNFSAVDWSMSLEPHWFSSMYGPLILVGQALTALSLTTFLICLARKNSALTEGVETSHLHDLGNMLLAFVMIWAYLTYSQYLIVWSGNLPEEIGWYIHRTHGGWLWVSILLIVFHFVSPFIVLLFRDVKRRASLLLYITAGLLIVRFVEVFWLVVPAFHPKGFEFHWMDLTTFAGIGGVWIFWFLRSLAQRPLLAVHDPYLEGLKDDD